MSIIELDIDPKNTEEIPPGGDLADYLKGAEVNEVVLKINEIIQSYNIHTNNNGSAHDLATEDKNGFMSIADRLKLDSIDLSKYQLRIERNEPGGYAGLDAGNLVGTTQSRILGATNLGVGGSQIFKDSINKYINLRTLKSSNNSILLTTNSEDITLTVVPRYTTVERDALIPVNGDLIFNTTDSRFNYYNTGWKEVILCDSDGNLEAPKHLIANGSNINHIAGAVYLRQDITEPTIMADKTALYSKTDGKLYLLNNTYSKEIPFKTDLDAYQLTIQKGQANGYAGLDANQLISEDNSRIIGGENLGITGEAIFSSVVSKKLQFKKIYSANSYITIDSSSTAVRLTFDASNLEIKGTAQNLIDTQNIITKEYTGFRYPDEVIVTYNSAGRTITLTGNVEAYYQGKRVTALTVGWLSPPHDISFTGNLFLKYDGTNFIWSNVVWSFSELQIAVVNNNFGLREPHGFIQWQVHSLWHEALGTVKLSGGTLSNYNLNDIANKRPYVSETKIKDEDLTSTLSLLSTNAYTTFKLTGTGASSFITDYTDIVPLLVNRPYYNEFSGGNWIQTLMSAGYMSIWQVAIPVTNDVTSQKYRYIWIQGQSISSNNAAGLNEQQSLTPASLNLGDLSSLSPEYVFINQIIINYNNTNWSIAAVKVITGSKVSQTTFPSGNYLNYISSLSPLAGTGIPSDPLYIIKKTNTLTVGSQGCDYTTIQEAINASSANGTILIYPGNYYETLTINKNGLTFIGIGKAGTINIIPLNPLTNLINFANYTEIKFIRVGLYFEPTTAISLIEGSTGNITFEDCKINLDCLANLTQVLQPTVIKLTSSGEVRITGGRINYSHQGQCGLTAEKLLMIISDGSEVNFEGIEQITIENSGTAALTSLIKNSSLTGKFYFSHNNLKITDLTATNVCAINIITGSGILTTYDTNIIEIFVGTLNIGSAFYLDGINVLVESRLNEINVTDTGGTSYGYRILNNAVLNSNRDKIVAADSINVSGGGIDNKMATSINGYIYIDNSLSIKEVSAAPATVTDYARIYTKADRFLYYKHDDGIERKVEVMRTRYHHVDGGGHVTISTTEGIAKAFVYPGTNSKETLTAIKIVAQIENNANTASCRILDNTNGDNVIASNTAISFTTSGNNEIKDLGSITNLPSGPAVFEVVIKTNTNNNDFIIYGIILEYTTNL